jgi:hypothetical protein
MILKFTVSYEYIIGKQVDQEVRRFFKLWETRWFSRMQTIQHWGVGANGTTREERRVVNVCSIGSK